MSFKRSIILLHIQYSYIYTWRNSPCNSPCFSLPLLVPFYSPFVSPSTYLAPSTVIRNRKFLVGGSGLSYSKCRWDWLVYVRGSKKCASHRHIGNVTDLLLLNVTSWLSTLTLCRTRICFQRLWKSKHIEVRKKTRGTQGPHCRKSVFRRKDSTNFFLIM